LWQDHVVVESADLAFIYATNGRLLWTRAKRGGSPLAIANGDLYLVSPLRQLTSFDANNQPRMAAVPIAIYRTEEFHINLLWPQLDDFVASAYMPHPTYDTEDMRTKRPSPELFTGRTVYGKTLPTWIGEFAGALKLVPLYNPNNHEWLVGYDQIHVINTVDGESLAKFALPVDKPVTWSVDHASTICVAGYDAESRKLLVALNSRGEKLWHWNGASKNDLWADQPPIRANGGRVYALTQSRVLAIDKGVLAWQFDAGNEPLRHGTALADGTLLLTSNKTLSQIDTNGRRVFSISLPENIETPPVVDGVGGIYIATAKALYRIR
jgi:outer membrane protein assembly factor BamB